METESNGHEKKTATELVHQQSFTVRIHEINQERALTVPALLKLMQETSMQHIIKLKASVWDLESQNISWVLLRKKVHVLKHVQMGDRLTIVTYPTGFEKFFAYRDFLVFDDDKKLVATASSMWSLIDTDSRKIARVPENLLGLEVPQDIKRLVRPKGNMPKTELYEAESRTIRHYDLDWNGHINNTVLCRYMIEVLLAKGVAEKDLKVLNFQFKNECSLGTTVTIHRDEAGKVVTVMNGEQLVSGLWVGE